MTEKTPPGAGPDAAAETAVKALFDSLGPDQRAEVCFPWNHVDPRRGLLRSFVSNHWYVTRPFIRSAFYTSAQQDLVHDIYTGLINPEWYDRFLQQTRDDTYGQDWGEEQSLAIFGTPGSGKFQFVMTGRHMTLRADGGSEDRLAFGGPILYGHDPEATYTERSGHPGNVFWHQAELAAGVLDLLDGPQRSAAIVDRLRHEADMSFRTASERDGLAVAEMTADQRTELRKVLAALLDPFRASDRRRVLACLDAQGGLDSCHLAFYREGRLAAGDSGPWDNWRLEGPAFAWYFRGSPHAHVWVNVADEPDVPFNASIREVVDPMPEPSVLTRRSSRPRTGRIVAISSVKNEIDIIEPFVRHALTFAERIVVADNGSTDGTLDILRALEREGLPLTIVEDPSAGKYLSQRMTRLMREFAVDQLGADWILPLDADEFPIVDEGHSLIPEDARADATISLPWRTYVPEASDDAARRNPVLRIRHRLVEEAFPYVKAIVPRALAVLPDAVLTQGNHAVRIGDRPCDAVGTTGACLGHFPARGEGQYLAKVAISAFQHHAMGSQAAGLAFHLWEPYELLKRDIEAFSASFAEGARRFAVPPGAPFHPETVLDPLPYHGGPILHTPKVNDRERGWHAVIRYAESLADRYAALNAGLSPDQRVARERKLNEVVAHSPPTPLSPADPEAPVVDPRVRELEAALGRQAAEIEGHLRDLRRSWTWRVGSAAVWPAAHARRVARGLLARRRRPEERPDVTRARGR
ncbi:glycosyltransferase family 2 protein [Aquisphaera insulae]|uniref:glycosyltransferase family 2 protein n=1 Tax=Aquisphaera insulae TaxID=2712864 RepID=UPI0013EC2D1C|nr:glycosyltransferase family 2 protein [Aquisphaera insulae]